ncbi:MAG: hypothetical protein DRG20_04850 [Deltaproteobacteria bacterium]|nr:outer membrane protein assembly factor BamE [Deltaproteobacteria bacterium]RLA89315.1 MAG: hypothetical protein DRG20_04850 [Deltaproteobacteria bacterium]
MKRKRLLISVLIISFLFIFYGCVGVGKNFKSDKVKDIKIGITTAEELRDWFGPPDKKGIDNGDNSWTYFYEKWSLFGGTQSKELYVVFDKNWKVKSFTFSSNLPEDQ